MLERNAAAWFFYIYFPENRKREFHSEYEKKSHKRVMPETENRFGRFFMFRAESQRVTGQVRRGNEVRLGWGRTVRPLQSRAALAGGLR